MNARGGKLSGTLFLLALLVAASAGGLSVLAGSAERGGTFERYSTHRAEPDGALALHDWLKERGFEVRRETEAIVALPDDGSLLVVIGAFQEDEPRAPASAPAAGPPPPAAFFGPRETYSPSELQAIQDWVERGGRLLLLERHRNTLSERFGVKVESDDAAAKPRSRTRAVALSPYTAKGGPLELASAAALALPDDGKFLPLHRRADGRVVAASGAVGRGEVVVVADPWLATNEGIARAGNADLLWSIATTSPTAVVRFDERRHGFVSERNVMGFARRHGLDAAVLQVVLAFALLAWASRAPSARPRVAPAREGGIESREFVSAMANIYQRMGLSAHAVEGAYRRAERALAAALRSRSVATTPWPGDEAIRTQLRAMGVQNWSGWETVREGYEELKVALATGSFLDRADEGALGRWLTLAARVAEKLGAGRLAARRRERWVLSYARFASRFEREVREAARIGLDDVL